MDQGQIERIGDHPGFRALVRRRMRFAWGLAAVMLGAYGAFIGVLAFDPGLLGRPIAPGTTITIGIPVSLALIVLAIALTGIYVGRANSRFDDLHRRLLDETRE